MSYDVLVIGGGPAGLSASINVRARGRSALVVSNPLEENPLWRAEKVDNYLGLPGLCRRGDAGRHAPARGAGGVEFLAGKVLTPCRCRTPGMSAWAGYVQRQGCGAGGGRGPREEVCRRGGASGPGRQLLRHLRRDALPGQAGGGGGIHRHRPAGGGVSPENRLLRDLFRPPQAVRDPGRRPGGVRHLRRPDHSGGGRVHPAAHHGPPRSCSRGWRWNRAM